MTFLVKSERICDGISFFFLYPSLATAVVQNPLEAFLKPIVRFGKGFCSSAAAISEALLCIVEVLSSNVV